MKNFLRTIIPVLVVLAMCFGVGYMLGWGVGRLLGKKQTVVVLSTNDMHAAIDNFPRLATAVAQCRDSVATVLVDAGDRWTGNAFVDMAAEPRRPIIDLMNAIGYDVVTLGNHEFDSGAPYLDKMMSLLDSRVVCANLVSSDTAQFRQTEPYAVVVPEYNARKLDVELGFLGVVTNYGNNNHPDGNDESFAGLLFPDPQQTAADYYERLREECDLPIVLSHMGDDRDSEFAKKFADYPLIIGGHTHREMCDTINGVRIVQTGKNLKNIGVTVLRFKGKKLRSMEYRNVPLATYDADPVFETKVREIKSAPELLAPVGEVPSALDKVGLASLVNGAIKRSAKVDIAIYHYGGIRLDNLAKGGISKADIYTLEPFSSQIYTMRMTPRQLEAMIVAKYNDTKNAKESHRIDLFMSEPYTILTDSNDEAYAVVFPTLKADKQYRVAMGDYIYKNYEAVEAQEVERDVALLTDALIDFARSSHIAQVSNKKLQSVRMIQK